MRKAASPLLFVTILLFVIIAILLAAGDTHAQDVPRDFITGEGWFLKQPPSTPPDGPATFGVSGGVKSGNWFGDLVYVDKALGLEVKSLTGSHTLVIEVTGTANPSSGGAFIVVDAFDVRP